MIEDLFLHFALNQIKVQYTYVSLQDWTIITFQQDHWLRLINSG